MIGRRRWVGLTLAGVGIFISAVYVAYARDMRVTRERLSAESQIVQTRHGPVEFDTWGSGPTVLAVHGAGGGHDQGRAMAEAFGGEGLSWIAPSRFGYLRSPLPPDASTAAQADAFADLLDQLGVSRVAIVAMSGGVPPALQFARRYPERTRALVLLSSAPYTPLTATQQTLPVPIWMYQALFASDFPLWVLSKLAPSGLDAIFDVRPDFRAALTPTEKTFVNKLMAAFQPVTDRIKGLNNEGAAIDPMADYRLEEITAPTLVIHARDDGINPFTFGEHTAAHVKGAQFLPLSKGGHLLLGHHAEIRARVETFLRNAQQ